MSDEKSSFGANQIGKAVGIRGLPLLCHGLRWLLILSVSLLITLPLVEVIARLTDSFVLSRYGINPTSVKEAKDVGYGLVAFAPVFAAAAVSFVVVWPASVWVIRKLINRMLRKCSASLKG